MRVPLNPQSFSDLRGRYVKAIENAWDVSKDGETFPSSRPENIFDTQTGLRIIVARDVADKVVILHVSVSSFTAGSGSWTTLHTRNKVPSSRFKNAKEAVDGIRLALEQIMGQKLPAPDLDHITPKGVVHLMWKWQDRFMTVGHDYGESETQN